MEDEIFVQIKFEKSQGKYKLRDALYIPYEAYQNMAPQAIEALKTQRFNDYKDVKDNPPAYVAPSLEDLQLEKEALELRLAEVNAAITLLQ